jgi:glycosyltransferase involved in cell wall biosynthesis
VEIKNSLKGLFWRSDFYGAYTDGGMSSMHNGILNGLLQLGHKAVFASSGRMKLPQDIPVYFIPHSKFLWNLPEVLNLPYNRKVTNELTKIIEREKPDFLYQHHADFNYSGTILKKKLGLPFFLQCESVQFWIKEKWGKIYLKKLLRDIEEIQWDQSDAIFVISEEVKRHIVSFGVDENKIYVNSSSVNPDVFHPDIDGSVIRKKYNLCDKFVIGFTGTFAPWHGVEILAESVKIITNSIKNAIVFFVGDGMLRPKIEEILKRDNVENKAIITGMQPFELMPEFIAACDVVVSPCVQTDESTEFFNSPIKLFEYLGMGKPIVASNVGQQSYVIQNEVNGIHCNQKSPEDLAEGIIKLYKNPDLSNKISIQARKDAVEKYNWINNSKRIIDVYNKMFGKKS